MDRRIHDVLDDLGSLDDLSPAERQEALDLARTLDSIGALVRDVPSPDFTEQVMRRIASHPQPRRKTVSARVLSAFEWFWRPRTLAISLRPVSALAGFMVFLIAALTAGQRPAPVFEAASPAATAPPIYVQFRLEDSNATRVSVVGSFSGWEPLYDMEQTSPGVWSTLVPLQPGVHDYVFLVDGQQWVADPHAFQVDDGFGGVNSRIALPQPPSLRS